jgi:hypothetical protein
VLAANGLLKAATRNLQLGNTSLRLAINNPKPAWKTAKPASLDRNAAPLNLEPANKPGQLDCNEANAAFHQPSARNTHPNQSSRQ